jgi:hypothetical protein
MFRKLCGPDYLKNVVIVTNMWSKEVTMEEQNRERELRNDTKFFKSFIDDHATMVRHNNTLESAHSIIRQIYMKNPLPLDIQRETVLEDKILPSTGAGITLRIELLGPAENLQALLDNLQARLKAARDERNQVKVNEIQRDILEMIPSLARLYNELKNLESLSGSAIDVRMAWDKMNPKTQIIAIYRRSFGVENSPEINQLWAALGDTVSFFRKIPVMFDEFPLPLSVNEQLLHDEGGLTQDTQKRFDDWFKANRDGIRRIRTKVQHDLIDVAAPRRRKRERLPVWLRKPLGLS